MLPAFLDSMVSLIVRTSTDLPPDVRAAMRVAMDREDEVRSTPGAGDHRPEHRPGGRGRRGDLPGHRDADLRGQDPGRRQPGGAETADPRGRGRGHQARQAAAQLGGLADRRELRQQPRAGHADHPLRAVGARRDRGQADPQGRRLREHERPVLAAGRTAASRPRRSHASRACASASCTRSGRRRARAVRPAPSASRIGGDRTSGYVHAKEQLFRTLDDVNPDQRLAALEAEIMAHGEPPRRRHDGLRRPHLAHRLQGRRAEPPAGQLLRLGGLRLLGVPPAGRRARRDVGRDPTLAVPRSGGAGAGDDGPGRLPAHRPRGGADHAARRGDRPLAEGRRRGAGERAAPTPAATPSTTT